MLAIGYKSMPTRETDFRYDGMGRRTAIIEVNGTTSTETRYTWCGNILCRARNASDTVTRLYYPEGEVWPQGGTRLYYSTDQLGSVRDVLVAQNGARVAAYDYDPYGNPTSSMGRIFVDFRYAGMFYHQASGLYLTQYRAYDPRTGRWLSHDPIEEEGGLNLYGYVGGNPTGYIDPDGRYYQLVGFGVGFFGDLGYQLWQNGGNFSCVHWVEAVGWGLAGATGGALGEAGAAFAEGLGFRAALSRALGFGAKSEEKAAAGESVAKGTKTTKEIKTRPTKGGGMEGHRSTL